MKATDELTRRYKAVKEACNNETLPIGTYKKLHDAVIEEFQLSSASFKISQHTIRKRFRTKVKTDNRNRSIVHEIEPILQKQELLINYENKKDK